MRTRVQGTFWLAMLMALAPLHCVAHTAECAHHRAEVEQLLAAGFSAPADEPPPPCDNESGCICRGAVLAHAVDPSFVSPRGLEFLIELPAPTGWFVELSPPLASVTFEDHAPAPLSGKILRAHLASFQI